MTIGMPKTMPDLERVLGNLEIGDCWEWNLRLEANGYARTIVGSRLDGSARRVIVHRFVYESLVGPIPDGLQLDHLCRNRKCCNPDHLEPVTAAENIRRGRTSAWQKAKTHCPQGHDYATNARIRRGCRECVICVRATARRTYHRKKNAA